MSRPALYLVFKNKEELFVGVVQLMIDNALEAIVAGLDEHRGLAAKLSHIFEVWTVQPYELVSRAPDAKELIEHSHGFADEVLDAGQARLTEVIAGVLRSEGGGPPGLPPEQTGRVMAAAVRGFKSDARTTAELRALIDGLIHVVTRAEASHPE
jgi:AcrR family transcriptional regulator